MNESVNGGGFDSGGQKIYVIGCGPGGRDYLLPLASITAQKCAAMAGAERLVDLFPGFNGEFFSLEKHGISGIFDLLEAVEGPTGVLVSGCPLLFSLTRRVLARFGHERCQIIPGISSVSVACSMIGINGCGVEVLSSHASLPTYKFNEVSGYRKIAVLCGNTRYHCWIQTLALYMQATHRIVYCRDLTLEGQVIKSVKASELPEIMRGGRELLLFLSGDMVLRDIEFPLV